jgi:putative nucleotidyltransferase with HDIG domain
MILDTYLSTYPELLSLYDLVREDFSKKGLIHHNWDHVVRDMARAVLIAESEEADMKIVLAGVLLHDIGRLYPSLGRDHYSVGAEVAPRYLEPAGFTDEDIGKIVHCIKSHGPRGIIEPRTAEAKVVYDVEVLSCSVGYIGVGRVFDYFMREEGMGVEGMLNIPSGKKGPRKDFYTKTGEKRGKEGLEKAGRFWKEIREELELEESNIREVIPDYKQN